MSEEVKHFEETFESTDLVHTMRKSFLEYSMSVIVSRALPDVRDGLKPVHRRILYGMSELGVTPDKPHKKSARIVGDVMGKYHPHGDSAIYDAMVRMAQDFSYRYPLIDGHGNFGSVDGDGAAAMRYTEARMSKIALEMLRDINKDTINFRDNYDSTEREPEVLPARIPNLLVNGATGIAVGMATNIPPHNLAEVISALHLLMKNPEVTTTELMEALPGPDFPTGGLVLGKSGIRRAYETGRGSITVRGRVQIEELKNGIFWFRQGHIFSSPFYYIDYTLAQVCAFQFWIKSREDREKAWQDYLNLCKLGGSKSFFELMKSANLKNPFKEGTIAAVIPKIKEYLDSIDDMNL